MYKPTTANIYETCRIQFSGIIVIRDNIATLQLCFVLTQSISREKHKPSQSNI